jgi:hypothetical protein
MQKVAPVVVVFMAMFCSCQKGLDPWPANGIDTTPVIHLARPELTRLRTTTLATSQTGEWKDFKLDAENRVAGVADISYDSTVFPVHFDTIAVHEYFYNGQDTLPFKLVIDEGGGIEIHSYFTYSAAGKLVYDSTVNILPGAAYYVTYNIQYPPGKMVCNYYESNLGLRYADTLELLNNDASLLEFTDSAGAVFKTLTYNKTTFANPVAAFNIRAVWAHKDFTDAGWPLYSSRLIINTIENRNFDSASGSYTLSYYESSNFLQDVKGPVYTPLRILTGCNML